MSADNFEKKEPVFEQRDESRTRKSTAESTGIANDSVGVTGMNAWHGEDRRVVSGGNGGGVWKLLVLALALGLGAVGWFAWQQSLQHRALTERFEGLASRINSTDESLNQSGTVMSLRIKEQSTELEKHWSEIRKLWAVANDRNRKALDKHQATLAEHKRVLKKVESSVASATKSMAGLVAKVDTAQGDALAVSAQFDDLRGELHGIRSSIDKADKQVQLLHDTVANNRIEHEKAMTSVDSFRRQTNQQLQAIQAQLGQP